MIPSKNQLIITNETLSPKVLILAMQTRDEILDFAEKGLPYYQDSLEKCEEVLRNNQANAHLIIDNIDGYPTYVREEYSDFAYVNTIYSYYNYSKTKFSNIEEKYGYFAVELRTFIDLRINKDSSHTMPLFDKQITLLTMFNNIDLFTEQNNYTKRYNYPIELMIVFIMRMASSAHTRTNPAFLNLCEYIKNHFRNLGNNITRRFVTNPTFGFFNFFPKYRKYIFTYLGITMIMPPYDPYFMYKRAVLFYAFPKGVIKDEEIEELYNETLSSKRTLGCKRALHMNTLFSYAGVRPFDFIDGYYTASDKSNAYPKIPVLSRVAADLYRDTIGDEYISKHSAKGDGKEPGRSDITNSPISASYIFTCVDFMTGNKIILNDYDIGSYIKRNRINFGDPLILTAAPFRLVFEGPPPPFSSTELESSETESEIEPPPRRPGSRRERYIRNFGAETQREKMAKLLDILNKDEENESLGGQPKQEEVKVPKKIDAKTNEIEVARKINSQEEVKFAEIPKAGVTQFGPTVLKPANNPPILDKKEAPNPPLFQPQVPQAKPLSSPQAVSSLKFMEINQKNINAIPNIPMQINNNNFAAMSIRPKKTKASGKKKGKNEFKQSPEYQSLKLQFDKFNILPPDASYLKDYTSSNWDKFGECPSYAYVDLLPNEVDLKGINGMFTATRPAGNTPEFEAYSSQTGSKIKINNSIVQTFSSFQIKNNDFVGSDLYQGIYDKGTTANPGEDVNKTISAIVAQAVEGLGEVHLPPLDVIKRSIDAYLQVRANGAYTQSQGNILRKYAGNCPTNTTQQIAMCIFILRADVFFIRLLAEHHQSFCSISNFPGISYNSKELGPLITYLQLPGFDPPTLESQLSLFFSTLVNTRMNLLYSTAPEVDKRIAFGTGAHVYQTCMAAADLKPNSSDEIGDTSNRASALYFQGVSLPPVAFIPVNFSDYYLTLGSDGKVPFIPDIKDYKSLELAPGTNRRYIAAGIVMMKISITAKDIPNFIPFMTGYGSIDATIAMYGNESYKTITDARTWKDLMLSENIAVKYVRAIGFRLENMDAKKPEAPSNVYKNQVNTSLKEASRGFKATDYLEFSLEQMKMQGCDLLGQESMNTVKAICNYASSRNIGYKVKDNYTLKFDANSGKVSFNAPVKGTRVDDGKMIVFQFAKPKGAFEIGKGMKEVKNHINQAVEQMKEKTGRLTGEETRLLRNELEMYYGANYETAGFKEHKDLANTMAMVELLEADLLAPVLSTLASLYDAAEKNDAIRVSAKGDIYVNKLPPKFANFTNLFKDYLDTEGKEEFDERLVIADKISRIQTPLKPLSVLSAVVQNQTPITSSDMQTLQTNNKYTVPIFNNKDPILNEETLKLSNEINFYDSSVAVSDVPSAMLVTVRGLIAKTIKVNPDSVELINKAKAILEEDPSRKNLAKLLGLYESLQPGTWTPSSSWEDKAALDAKVNQNPDSYKFGSYRSEQLTPHETTTSKPFSQDLTAYLPSKRARN